MFTLLTKKMKHRKGFTLVELMVVIAIIGILAAVAIPKFVDTTASANGGKVLADLAAIDSAVSMYMANYGGTIPKYGDISASLSPEPTVPLGKIKIKGKEVTGEYGVSADGRATFGNKTAEVLQQ